MTPGATAAPLAGSDTGFYSQRMRPPRLFALVALRWRVLILALAVGLTPLVSLACRDHGLRRVADQGTPTAAVPAVRSITSEPTPDPMAQSYVRDLAALSTQIGQQFVRIDQLSRTMAVGDAGWRAQMTDAISRARALSGASRGLRPPACFQPAQDEWL